MARCRDIAAFCRQHSDGGLVHAVKVRRLDAPCDKSDTETCFTGGKRLDWDGIAFRVARQNGLESQRTSQLRWESGKHARPALDVEEPVQACERAKATRIRQHQEERPTNEALDKGSAVPGLDGAAHLLDEGGIADA
jgi:hypothetical protein